MIRIKPKPLFISVLLTVFFLDYPDLSSSTVIA